MDRMPTTFAGTVLDEHHRRSYLQELRCHALCARLNCTVLCGVRFAKQKYLLLVEVYLNENGDNLVIVPYSYEFVGLALLCQAKVERFVAWKRHVEISQLLRYACSTTDGIIQRKRTLEAFDSNCLTSGPRT